MRLICLLLQGSCNLYLKKGWWILDEFAFPDWKCLLDQRRPRCIVVRQPEYVLEILNQDCGIHLFQTWEKILAGLWLARCTQTEPAFVLLQTTSKNRERKLLESVEWGLEAIMSKRNACQFFLLEGQTCTEDTGYSTWQKGSSASLCSCLQSTKFSQDIRWFFYLAPNCSEAQQWFVVALGFMTSE